MRKLARAVFGSGSDMDQIPENRTLCTDPLRCETCAFFRDENNEESNLICRDTNFLWNDIKRADGMIDQGRQVGASIL